ncbi:hypothetical protein B0H10DRAFT_1953358 [Mycena sp. CBHHK59/15]|nr:hypothetical protein B0H10DRAFT_1953358 [Mycena sp. CBHHK59/15]
MNFLRIASGTIYDALEAIRPNSRAGRFRPVPDNATVAEGVAGGMTIRGTDKIKDRTQNVWVTETVKTTATEIHLVNGGHRNVKNSSVVYLPIQLVHSTVWRDKETKERVPLPSFTFEETGQLFQDQKGDFEANKVELSALISSHIPWDIRKIVAFACGTPSRKPTHVPSVVQHIVVLALKDIFIEKEGNTKQVLCFAQDPIYSVIDKQLLAQHNIACCDDPRGFLEVDKWSLVISIAPNIPVKQIITDLARPAVIIWGRISGESEYSTADMTDPESPRLLKMIEQGYTEFAFPNYADSFKSVVMYGLLESIEQSTISSEPVANAQGIQEVAKTQIQQELLPGVPPAKRPKSDHNAFASSSPGLSMAPVVPPCLQFPENTDRVRLASTRQ